MRVKWLMTVVAGNIGSEWVNDPGLQATVGLNGVNDPITGDNCRTKWVTGLNAGDST